MAIESPPTTNTASVVASVTPEVVAAESLSAEVDDIVELPTIQLTNLDEEMGVENAADDIGVLAVAETVCTSSRDAELYGGFSTRKMDYSDNRAEFISVTFWKDHPNIPLGINLMKGQCRISSLKENSISSNSPLRPGDKVLSVNNKDCATSNLSGAAIARILSESFGRVTMVVHNEGGKSDLVESMVTKANPDEKAGITIGHTTNGSVKITKIRDGSLFSNSLLNSGDSALAINGAPVAHLQASEIGRMIKNSPKTVTILARTLRETGVVVAQLSERYIASSNVPVYTEGQTNVTTINNRPRTTSQQQEIRGSQDRALSSFFCAIVMIGAFVAAAVTFTRQEDE